MEPNLQILSNLAGSTLIFEAIAKTNHSRLAIGRIRSIERAFLCDLFFSLP